MPAEEVTTDEPLDDDMRLLALFERLEHDLGAAIAAEREGLVGAVEKHEFVLQELRRDLDELGERVAKVALGLIENYGGLARRVDGGLEAVEALGTLAQIQDGRIDRLERAVGLHKPWWRRWFS